MAGIKWDELNNDCLVQIFAKVDTGSLVQYIPFVCKSWYRATFDPQCWTTLTFSYSNSDNLVKCAVGRSQRSATVVVFEHGFCDARRHTLLCIAEGCPLLKTLILPRCFTSENGLLISQLICNWKHLEYFRIWKKLYFEQILESISLHCGNFVGFICIDYVVDEELVSAIVKFTPKIKFLRMPYSRLSRKCLVMLLKGCAALETLDIGNCIGYKEGDGEIMMLASNIKSFNCSE